MKVKLGATRKVFIFKNFVVKVPNAHEYRLFLNGILGNLQEKAFSKMGRYDLAKVKFCDILGLVLIMERAQMVDVENVDYENFKDKLEEIYKDDDMKEFMLSDAKPSNWGYIKERLVKIDYGN